MDELQKAYQDGFIEYFDKNGKKVLVLQPVEPGATGSAFVDVITVDGFFIVKVSSIGGPKNIEAIDWADFSEKVKAKNPRPNASVEIELDENLIVDKSVLDISERSLDVYTRDMTNAMGLERAKNALIGANARGEKRRATKERLSLASEAKNILSSLIETKLP
jgi:hypothetical protein